MTFIAIIAIIGFCYAGYLSYQKYDENKYNYQLLKEKERIAIEAKEKEEKRKFDFKNSIELLFSNKNDGSISVNVNNLPKDFEDEEYICFDFETADKSPLSAISLGLARYKGSNLLEIKEFRFSPIYNETENDNEFMFTYVHGIKPSDVKGLPTIVDIWDEISPYLNSHHLVAHNAEFDINVLQAILNHAKKKVLGNRISCTYELSKKYLKYEESYKLESLCNSLNIPYWNHKAGYDAVSCGILFIHILGETPGGATTENVMRGKKLVIKT
ncbi:exonuclease domain-containing protein [Sphingobacterium multivorum]|uniref:exonuclease domain-containing protein n=1 Tax=Sphingobacterium multivorum TaxID=28454 RepID=UPI003DA207FA